MHRISKQIYQQIKAAPACICGYSAMKQNHIYRKQMKAASYLVALMQQHPTAVNIILAAMIIATIYLYI